MGGGAAGKISYPEYISLIHSRMLDDEGASIPDTDMVTAFNNAIAVNPFTGETAFNPDTTLTQAYTDITAHRTLVSALNPSSDYSSAITAMETAVDGYINTDYITSTVPTIAVDDSALDEDSQAFAAIQNSILENILLPPWKAGMHNINAVTSSAYVIGEAIIRGMTQQDIAKYTSGVRTQIVAKNNELNAEFIRQRQDSIVKFNVQRNEIIRQLASTVVEELLRKADAHAQVAVEAINYAQVHIAAKYDELDTQLTIEENEVKWELGLFREAGAFIGTMQVGGGGGPRRPSRGATIAAGAITGAVNGAATGASQGGYGAIIGAVVGAAVGAGAAALQTS